MWPPAGLLWPPSRSVRPGRVVGQTGVRGGDCRRQSVSRSRGSHPTSWSAIWTCLCQHHGKHLMAEDWKLWPKAFQSLGHAVGDRHDVGLCTPLQRNGQTRSIGTGLTWPSTQLVDARSGPTQNWWVHDPGPRLVVLTGEVGGRWSAETAMFLRLIAKAKARTEPLVLRLRAELAWRARW